MFGDVLSFEVMLDSPSCKQVELRALMGSPARMKADLVRRDPSSQAQGILPIYNQGGDLQTVMRISHEGRFLVNLIP